MGLKRQPGYKNNFGIFGAHEKAFSAKDVGSSCAINLFPNSPFGTCWEYEITTKNPKSRSETDALNPADFNTDAFYIHCLISALSFVSIQFCIVYNFLIYLLRYRWSR